MKLIATLMALTMASASFAHGGHGGHHGHGHHKPHKPVVVVKPKPHKPVVVVKPRPARPVVVVRPGPVVVHRPHPGPIYVRPVHPRPDLSWRYPVERWEASTYLGYTWLTDAKDNDTIYLPSCQTRANNYISQLKIVVGQRPVEIEWVYVTFENGESDLIELNREYFRAGSSSGWKDLRGGYRCVRQIEILGDAETNGAQAQVLFYGR